MKTTKSVLIAAVAAAFLLAACAAPATKPKHEQPGLSVPRDGASEPGSVRRPGEKEAAVPPSGEASLKIPPLVAAPHAVAPPEPEPDAVIKLDPLTGRLSDEMENRLARIADDARGDERIIVRLESYVPAGGSPALSIGIGDKVLHRVRERLQSLGVSPRRILMANFGGEFNQQRDPSWNWVEIYLLKPSY